ncbi:hypothetical protein [Burkholderia phage vB_BglM_WTB]
MATFKFNGKTYRVNGAKIEVLANFRIFESTCAKVRAHAVSLGLI